MSFLNKIFGDSSEKLTKKLLSVAEAINELEPQFSAISSGELKTRGLALKKQAQEGGALDDLLNEAFALTREAAKRTLGQRHFDVQMVGGIVLHQGKIAEMKTGEGKTLAATSAVFLNALSGKGVHVVTVNDYLAKRDAVWMGQIYYMLGLSVGCIINEASFLYDENYDSKIQNENEKLKIGGGNSKDSERDATGSFRVEPSYLRPCSRKEAYAADITYGTNNEFGFDYLRDNLVLDKNDKVQRGFYFAIVDEVDSILIDEARTPLIISQPDLESSQLYRDFSRIIPRLKENIDFNIDEKMRVATLTEEGIAKIEKIVGVSNIYEAKGMRYLHYLEESLRAKALFHKDRDYIVKDNEIVIIDEFTGRILPGRRYSGGLHQAIEAKEGVQVQPESKILATITFQNYFRMYEKLAGMTGTALTSSEEFDKVYKLLAVSVPTNKLCVREDKQDLIFKNEAGKFRAIVQTIKEKQEKGQPVLVGTRSVEKNEYLGKLLAREGIRHEILNAKNHQREGEIIAQAGKIGAVTVATNMAGRGVDIILGGNPPDKEQAEKVKQLGGLFVLGTERHESRRIDNQLRGRAGRQGDPGQSQFFVSLEDELVRIFGGDRLKNLMEMLKMTEDQPITAKIISSAIEKAQTKVEGLYFDSRSHILQYDDVIAKQRNKIYQQRNDILEKGYDDLRDFVLGVLRSETQNIVLSHASDNGFDVEEIFEEAKTILPLNDDARFQIAQIKEADELVEKLQEIVSGAFEQKEKIEGKEAVGRVLRFACLKTIDFFWTEHLVSLEHLRDAAALRAYGGKDPLTEYKTEGHKLFGEMWQAINSQISRTVFKLSVQTE
ncbi:MAG: preprotein translocase subunit SecA [Patescibacteria group bacterium]|nr:preprotein translocase subunit SecA [Patescibacteria group bacterium]